MPSSRGPSQPRDRTQVSGVSCLAGGIFTPLSHLGSPEYVHGRLKIVEYSWADHSGIQEALNTSAVPSFLLSLCRVKSFKHPFNLLL